MISRHILSTLSNIPKGMKASLLCVKIKLFIVSKVDCFICNPYGSLKALDLRTPGGTSWKNLMMYGGLYQHTRVVLHICNNSFAYLANYGLYGLNLNMYTHIINELDFQGDGLRSQMQITISHKILLVRSLTCIPTKSAMGNHMVMEHQISYYCNF